MAAQLTTLVGRFDEDVILTAFAREGLTPHRWSNAPGDVYGAHSHGYEKLLYCLRGSITFRLTASGESLVLCAGDRLEIDAGTEHAAVVGADGVICVEAARTPIRR